LDRDLGRARVGARGWGIEFLGNHFRALAIDYDGGLGIVDGEFAAAYREEILGDGRGERPPAPRDRGAAQVDAKQSASRAAPDTQPVQSPGRACWRLGSRALAVGLAGLVVGLVACPERADRTAAVPAVPASEGGPGRILYLTYCQGCHGLGGRGDGPAATSLRTPPPDLTRLWQSYGTPLDRERVVEYIDGRGLIGAHGPREMPVWGDEFFEDAPPLATNLVEGARRHLIEVLVNYLETIQTQRQL
jgi:mono/diheme cytochrome c family protein